MGFFNKVSSPFKNVVVKEVTDPTNVLANGLLDKKDIEDPTGKFCGPVHIGMTNQNNYTQRRNVVYNRSEYDLPLIANAVQLDGILRRAVNIYVEQILKNGFEINSQNDKIQQHISRRLREIEYFTGLSKYELLSQISTQLVTYGNAYVIKVRANKTSKFGKSYRLFGRENYPIVGLFVADATTMEVGLNDKGDVTTYKQRLRGETNEWDERDVIHFTYNKIPGTLTGQSHLIPVLDDVRALRKLEEEIEILGFQYSIPLYLYKVGTKDIPPAPGEVAEVSSAIANMPNYGMLVIPGHHDVTIPANASNVMDIIKYVEHFKSRIYGGLGVSPVAMGQSDTSNRNTAQVSDVAMQTITKSYQQIIKNKYELDLFREIMLDGGFKNIEDVGEFRFPEIDVETQIKKETHIIAKWQNNIITRTEARNEMDYENKISDNDTFLRLVDIPKIDAQHQGQMELAQLNADTTKETTQMQQSHEIKMAKAAPKPAAPAAKESTPMAGLPKPTGAGAVSITKIHHKITIPKKPNGAVGNKVAPANQHGKATRPKYVKNSNENIFSGLTIFNKADFSSNLKNDVLDYLKEELDYTINRLNSFYHKDLKTYDSSIVDKYFSGLLLILEDRVVRASRFLDDSVKLDSYSQQTKEFIDDQVNKVHNLGKILMYKEIGVKTILITSDNCDKHADTTIDIANLDYSKIPPFGYQCQCDVDEENLNDEQN
jgi:hypothetical protein